MGTCDAIGAQLNRVFVVDDGGSGDRNLDVLRCVQGAVLATFRSCPGSVGAGLARRARFHPIRRLRVMHHRD